MSLNFNSKDILILRKETGESILKCKDALILSNGDIKNAIIYLKKNNISRIEDIKERNQNTSEGLINSYIHFGGKIGVLIEVNCETDFVARNEEFKDFTKNLCMHIAAFDPLYISINNIPNDKIEEYKSIQKKELIIKYDLEKDINKINMIINNKMKKWYSDICLLEQNYLKDQSITIGKLLNLIISKMGENIVIKQFIRYSIK